MNLAYNEAASKTLAVAMRGFTKLSQGLFAHVLYIHDVINLITILINNSEP